MLADQPPFFAQYLNYIPLACSAAILLQTGYKLAKPKLFKEYYHKGLSQFLSFVVTVGAILATDLLMGMAIGMAVGMYYVIKANYHAAITLTQDGSHYVLSLNKDVSFLNKALLRKFFLSIEENSTVVIDASKAQFIDHDILETIEDFLAAAPDDDINVKIVDLPHQVVAKVISSKWPCWFSTGLSPVSRSWITANNPKVVLICEPFSGMLDLATSARPVII